jgi:hypothetical protein
MRNAVFWDVTPCGSCKDRVSEERIASIIRVKGISELGTTTLMKETILSSQTSVVTRATRRHIPEDSNLHKHRRVIHKSYIALSLWAL